jgi:DNA-binding NtrC family response regulator
MQDSERLNILVVDNDQMTSTRIKDLLAGDGFGVEVLSEATRTVDELRTNHFQLVVLDVSPSNPGGRDALQQIRRYDSDLCVIATTALASVEMAVETMKHQAFHYLQKPVDDDEFRAVLTEAIQAKGLSADSGVRVNCEVGQRVRLCRKDQLLTLKQLANRVGKSVSLLSQIELGKSAASVSTLYELSRALGVKMTYFFESV